MKKPLSMLLTTLALVGVPVLEGCSVRAAIPTPVYSYVEGEEVRGIPPGHMPPPGSCRIWYPGAPPGQQPPPGNCDELARSVPGNAWLLYRPDQERRVFRIG